MPKQVILGAHFPGVNNTTVWSDPRSGSHIEFESFRRFAQTAERGRFDFLFLAEGLALREQRGHIHDLDVVGRPDTLPVLAALAGVTEHLGLVGTINATFNEPYELARQFATLDLLSQGRAGWNVVTSSDAFTGRNFRRGGYLPREQRYGRAESQVTANRHLWDSWDQDAVVADRESGQFRAGRDGDFAYSSDFFDIHGTFNTPRPTQGHPVIFQAGDSDDGREFAARTADAIFTGHGSGDDGRAFYRDIKGRLARYGRHPEDLKILPAASFIVGSTDEEARQISDTVRRQQVSGQTAQLILERIWNRDLSGFDPDGPLPDIEPESHPGALVQGRVQHVKDPAAEVARLRQLAADKNLSLREVAIEISARQNFVGSPETIADALIESVETGVSDGYILVPHITPGGLDDFVDHVVPILTQRGALRSEYAEGSTLRDYLALGGARSATAWEAGSAAGLAELAGHDVTERRASA
ncbi:NtaA/DmoA family FMN-dependent monooxygenase [Ornithinimicrobium faecis]|uniref:NtaA/DmoA family FMN-dependent monooxygenase n=1 Tax=Ornithinimicrobium faecis TaxID=2934158 RepID=UPI002119A6C9|nr:NtaA/DmoA family FMN-dependent monooxygenase [Ornithinimicrobium sp. HY1745]